MLRITVMSASGRLAVSRFTPRLSVALTILTTLLPATPGPAGCARTARTHAATTKIPTEALMFRGVTVQCGMRVAEVVVAINIRLL